MINYSSDNDSEIKVEVDLDNPLQAIYEVKNMFYATIKAIAYRYMDAEHREELVEDMIFDIWESIGSERGFLANDEETEDSEEMDAMSDILSMLSEMIDKLPEDYIKNIEKDCINVDEFINNYFLQRAFLEEHPLEPFEMKAPIDKYKMLTEVINTKASLLVNDMNKKGITITEPIEKIAFVMTWNNRLISEKVY